MQTIFVVKFLAKKGLPATNALYGTILTFSCKYCRIGKINNLSECKKVSTYHGEFYTTISIDATGYPILCKNTKVYQDGIQSRPDIMEYYGKPLLVYNYKCDNSMDKDRLCVIQRGEKDDNKV